MSHKNALKQLAPLELGGVQDVDQTVEGEVLDAADASATQLLTDMLPSTGSEEFISGWERELGIIPAAGELLESRRVAVSAALSAQGGLSKGYFIALALKLGYEIEIDDMRPAECGLMHLGDPLRHPRIWTSWLVRVLNHGMDAQTYYRRLGYPLFAGGPGAANISDITLSGERPYPSLFDAGLGPFQSLGDILPGSGSVVSWCEGPGGRCVGVGNGGLIVTTDDNGASFTDRSTSTAQNLTQVIHDGSRYVACGNTGTIVTSTTGDAWTVVTTSGLTTGNLTGIVYHPTANRYAVVSGGSSGWYSDDLTNWTSVTLGDVVTGQGCYFAPSGHVYFPANNGSIRRSWDCISWTNIGGLSGHQRRVFALGTHVVALSGNSQNGRIAISTTGKAGSWTSTGSSQAFDTSSQMVAACLLPDGRVAFGNTTKIWVGTLGQWSAFVEAYAQGSSALITLSNKVLSDRVGSATVDMAPLQFGIAAYRSSDLRASAPRPMSWWAFDANKISGTTVADLGGLSNALTLVGSPTFGTGKIGRAIVLDGTTQWAAFTDAMIPWSSRTAKTVSAWVKTDDTSTATRVVFTAQRQQGSTSFTLRQESGFWVGAHINGTTAVEATSSVPVTASWAHLVFVQDGTNIYLYVDGVLRGSASGAGTSTYGANPIARIGGTLDGSAIPVQMFDGLIDTVRLYDRALTAGEVASMYSSENAGTPHAPIRSVVGNYAAQPVVDMELPGATLTVNGISPSLISGGLSFDILGAGPGDPIPTPVTPDRKLWRPSFINGPLEKMLFARRPAGANPVFEYPEPE